ncbi:MAG: hypothetical protein AAFS03_07670 [Pseudomonadota bacterium]
MRRYALTDAMAHMPPEPPEALDAIRLQFGGQMVANRGLDNPATK